MKKVYLMIFIFLLTACGQRGALYLPSAKPDPTHAHDQFLLASHQ
jgi:predicted small lipoprotein YifL